MRRVVLMMGLAATLVLVGCKSAEESSAEHYQTALSLLEQGDDQRAFVELRTAIDRDERNAAARLSYADLLAENGAADEAYGQYLRVIEVQPDSLDARIAVARAALNAKNWEDAEAHGQAAVVLAPEDDRVAAISAMLSYRAATLKGDEASAAQAAQAAEDLLRESPDETLARSLVIDHLTRTGQVDEALARIEETLARDPEQPEYQLMRLGLMHGKQDVAGVRYALEEMAATFPNDPRIRQMLLTFYGDIGDLPAAEDFLRKRASNPEAGLPERTELVDFLRQTKGVDAARGYLDDIIPTLAEGDSGQGDYRVMHARLLFAGGDAKAAIAELEAVIAEGAGAEQLSDNQGALAQMYDSTGATEKASALVEEVLARDAGHGAALRLKAEWALREGRSDDAVTLLRRALTQEPRSLPTIALLARAHEAAGDLELAGGRYALAVEVSGNQTDHALSYVRFLRDRGRIDAAESVLLAGLSVAPTDIALLSQLGQVRLQQGKTDGVRQVIGRLRALQTEAAARPAERLDLALLSAGGQPGRIAEILEDRVANGVDDPEIFRLLVESHLRAGQPQAAETALNAGLERHPDSGPLRLLSAQIAASSGQMDLAERRYRELLDGAGPSDAALMGLIAILRQTDRPDEADAAIDTALQAFPEAPAPLLLDASRREARGDIDGAIAIYEGLNRVAPANPLYANNLASLLVSHRADDDSLAQAEKLVGRLQGSAVPAVQDTLGWIAYRRDNFTEAVALLEGAASALADDALVQYHLGAAYAALDMPEKAEPQLRKALALAESADLPEAAIIRDLLLTFQAP